LTIAFNKFSWWIRYSSFKRRHEPRLDKDRQKTRGPAKRFAFSAQGEFNPEAIRLQLHPHYSWKQFDVPDIKIELKGQQCRVFKSYCHYIIIHLDMRYFKNSWFSKSFGIRKESVPSEPSIFDRLWHAPLLDRKRSTSFTSALWMADRGLLKWNDYLLYWQTSRFL